MIRKTAAALMIVAGLYPELAEAERPAGLVEANSVAASSATTSAPSGDEQFVSRVSIYANQGRIAWSDVLKGLSRARGYDADSLDGLLPNTTFSLESPTTAWVLRQANHCLHPQVKMLVEERGRAGPILIIEMDRLAMLSSQRRFKKMLRNALLPSRYRKRNFGIVFDEAWKRQSSDAENLVVFVHGLNSHSDTVHHLLHIVRRNGHLAASFQYPNDQPIAESGELLKNELHKLARRYPDLNVDLVTHSMGGLVARAAIEGQRNSPANVDRLIMVSPPNQGSALAQFAFGLDIWEYMESVNNDENMTLFFSSIEDGLAEATVDLRPGSIFLTRLNALERNSNVRYTIVLGTGAPCSDEDLVDVRRKIRRAGEHFRLARFFGVKLDSAIADLDEVVQGRGDGCVSVKRGQLKGVSDIVELDFGHLDILNQPNNAEVAKVYELVLERLAD